MISCCKARPHPPLLNTMDIDNPQLVAFLQGIRSQVPQEIQPKIDDLIVYYQKK